MRTRQPPGSLCVAIGLALALALTACAAPTTRPTLPGSQHAEHDPGAERLKDALADDFGMTFEPAGPHHELGTAPDGVELDLIGVPVEEVILSLPSRDEAEATEMGLAYLPHLRELLHGPAPVWDWIAEGLACRADPDAACNVSTSRGSLSARFTDGGPGFVVLVVSRD